jgi:hypothetical protein
MFADKKKGVHKPTFIVHRKENFEALCYYVKMQTWFKLDFISSQSYISNLSLLHWNEQCLMTFSWKWDNVIYCSNVKNYLKIIKQLIWTLLFGCFAFYGLFPLKMVCRKDCRDQMSSLIFSSFFRLKLTIDWLLVIYWQFRIQI